MLRGDLSSFVNHFQLAAAPNTLVLRLFSPQILSTCKNILDHALDIFRSPHLPILYNQTLTSKAFPRAGAGVVFLGQS